MTIMQGGTQLGGRSFPVASNFCSVLINSTIQTQEHSNLYHGKTANSTYTANTVSCEHTLVLERSVTHVVGSHLVPSYLGFSWLILGLWSLVFGLSWLVFGLWSLVYRGSSWVLGLGSLVFGSAFATPAPNPLLLPIRTTENS